MLGSILLIRIGCVLVRVLLRKPDVSISTNLVSLSSSLEFCGIDNEGAIVAGVGGIRSGGTMGMLGAIDEMTPSEAGDIEGATTVLGATPLEAGVGILGDACGYNQSVDTMLLLLIVCSDDCATKVSQFGDVSVPAKYGSVENSSS